MAAQANGRMLLTLQVWKSRTAHKIISRVGKIVTNEEQAMERSDSAAT